MLAFIFFIFSIKQVQHYFQGSASASHIQSLIEKDLEKQIRNAKQRLTAETIQDLARNSFTSAQVSSFLHLPYPVYIYHRDSLLFWNQEAYYPNRRTDGKRIVPLILHEGKFLQYELASGASSDIHTYILNPIKLHVHNQGELQPTYFAAMDKENHFGYDRQTSNIQEALPMRVEQDVPYYLFKSNSPWITYHPYGWKLFVCAFPFIFMGISIHTYFKRVAQYKRKYRIFLYLVLTAIGIRAITYLTGFPNDFSEFKPFSSALFYHDPIFRSVGDLFINVCLLFWVLLFT